MTNPSDNRPHIRLRLQPSPKSRVGRSLAYLIEQGYVIPREFELFLEMSFLPFALKQQGEHQSGLYAAYESIGFLSGRIQSIRELYQIHKLQAEGTSPQSFPGSFNPQEQALEQQEDTEVQPSTQPIARPEFDLLNGLVNLP
jgi:hypothetical protein